MTKQQLASKIWESANKLRSKIEAGEYKDYILGFMFYKFLSDKEESWLKDPAQGSTDEEIKALSEDDKDTVKFIQDNLGYFIPYEHLFSTWIDKNKKKQFTEGNVTDALSSFNRNISASHKKVFENIFNTLETGLTKLGDSSGSRTKAMSDLIVLINKIPMDNKQDYDVLGYIYEYLISNFASNAGKKAGEFYTPHEVSQLMSEIVAEHLKDKDEIEIYDPTSGSGSLLITIGKSVSKRMKNPDRIKYYAQELISSTYNLTRMNLVMRGIGADNIITRNGDTLAEDWPYFDENDPAKTYKPLYVNAVVSNPPYSQSWDNTGKSHDVRYSNYGVAPKSKADYAFLLHDLYHIKPDGIMAIVLPHGVLFRGGDEGEIRKNLIENNNIDAIIGLPGDIFFGTPIATIIMVLRQKRGNADTLIIDASKGFVKSGKKRKLRARDIKKIVDAIKNRVDVPKFAKVVSRDEIRSNDYNLNISRYVDSNEESEKIDLYASVMGGIPVNEIDDFEEYWKEMKGLREKLFKFDGTPCAQLITDNVQKLITESKEAETYINNFESKFQRIWGPLEDKLIHGGAEIQNTAQIEEQFWNFTEEKLEEIPTINKYKVFQIIDDCWQTINADDEILRRDGLAACKKVDPKMVLKKDGDEEVQDGYEGRVFPFELVQARLLEDDLETIKAKQNRFDEIESELAEILESLSEEEKSKAFVNDDVTAFVAKELKNEVSTIYASVETEEINALKEYVELLNNKANKNELLNFISEAKNVQWRNIEVKKDGTYGKKPIVSYISKLQKEFNFSEGSYESKLIASLRLLDENGSLKKEIKEATEKLTEKTIETIENLDDQTCYDLLGAKWICPLQEDVLKIPQEEIDSFADRIKAICDKYEIGLLSLDKQIEETSKEFSLLLNDLTGDDYTMKSLESLRKLMGDL